MLRLLLRSREQYLSGISARATHVRAALPSACSGHVTTVDYGEKADLYHVITRRPHLYGAVEGNEGDRINYKERLDNLALLSFETGGLRRDLL